MKALLLRTVIIAGFVLSASSVFAQHTYYISKSLGSDSNSATQAQSNSAPWAHLPGMPSCASSCASYSPVAGDQFILYGGDTWGKTDLGVLWTWGGTSGKPIYIGVDQTWFNSSVCGLSWCRPIWNCQTSPCTNSSIREQMLQVGAALLT